MYGFLQIITFSYWVQSGNVKLKHENTTFIVLYDIIQNMYIMKSMNRLDRVHVEGGDELIDKTRDPWQSPEPLQNHHSSAFYKAFYIHKGYDGLASQTRKQSAKWWMLFDC